eukprot:8339743-Pyramimonas_sp.AAC.1
MSMKREVPKVFHECGGGPFSNVALAPALRAVDLHASSNKRMAPRKSVLQLSLLTGSGYFSEEGDRLTRPQIVP